MVSAAPSTCFFGLPIMGSWRVRAQQVASSRPHWRSAASLAPSDIRSCSAFCAIKRPFPSRMRLLRRLGKVVVFDVLDCWRQPDDGLACPDREAARRWFAAFFAGVPMDGVIFANRAMLDDLGDLVPNPVCIYHHFWPGMEPIEVRERARYVGYQGDERYLGPWRKVLDRACRRHGLEFVVNPTDLRSIDIGIAARGGDHGSFLSHRYKSNVKLANFYGAAIPCVVDAEAESYRETDNGEVRFFATAEDLELRLEELRPLATRQRIHRSFLQVRERFSLAAIAGQYDEYLGRLWADRAPATACS